MAEDSPTPTESSYIARLARAAEQPVTMLPLVLVRIATGIAVFFWCSKFLVNDDYKAIFVLPQVMCKYAGFEWVQVPPGDSMRWILHGVQAASLALAFGLVTRLAALLTGLSIVFVLLVERSLYVNHHYLLACASFWLAILPSGRCLALDAWLRPRHRSAFMPVWYLWLLRFQLGLPYVFGSIAKLNSDWLGGMPPGLMVAADDTYRNLLRSWGPELPTMMLVYGGIAYDALIVPALWFRKTRILGVLASLVFHLSNAALLSIGVFPWFMLATLTVFFSTHWWSTSFWTRSLRNWIERDAVPTVPKLRQRRWLLRFVALYVVVQLLLPWRHWFLPGNPSWNERGHRFAWRMMLRHKESLVHYKVVDKRTGDYLYLPLTTVMTGFQEPRAGRHPECLRQAAVQLAEMAKSFGVTDCEVYALALVSLNGREPKPMIDPSVDLLQVRRGWIQDDWVTTLSEPLRSPAWALDRELWWKNIELPPNFVELQDTTPQELLEYLHRIGAASQANSAAAP